MRNDECLMSGRRASRAARHMTEDVATGASAGQADAWTSWTSWFAGEDVDEPFGSLAHTLAIERLMEGHDRRLPIPDALDYLWRRGVAEGYPLRRLYVLDSPLHLSVAGTYNSATGDVWVRLDAARPDRGAAEVEAAGHVLHEISHAARARHGTRRPATIPAYHRDEAATQRLAHRLARRWRVAHLLTHEVRDAYVRLLDELQPELEAAGTLAGDLSLATAAPALDGLRALRARHGWNR